MSNACIELRGRLEEGVASGWLKGWIEGGEGGGGKRKGGLGWMIMTEVNNPVNRFTFH